MRLTIRLIIIIPLHPIAPKCARKYKSIVLISLCKVPWFEFQTSCAIPFFFANFFRVFFFFLARAYRVKLINHVIITVPMLN